MSNILVIPDIHGRKFWREPVYKALADKNIDEIIFLGDYLDPYPNEIDDNPELMECKSFYDYENLSNMLDNILSLKKAYPDKIILLTGNHTDSYIWSNFSSATRTDRKNWEKYHNFFLENLELFNLVWVKDKTIFTHAGISKDWAYKFLDTYMQYDESSLECDVILECVEVLKDTPLSDFNNHYIDAISEIGSYRGGYFGDYGSCEWADLREHISNIKFIKSENKEIIIPKDYNEYFQIFGHTQLVNKPIITDKWACLDCRQGFIVNTITHEISKC